MRKIFTFMVAVGMLLPTVSFGAEAVPTLYIASATTVTEDTPYSTDNFSLTIKAGSVYEAISHEGDSISVTVPENEAFEIRSLGPSPFRLENNIGQLACNVTLNKENQMVISGPVTANIVPSGFRCETSGVNPEDTSQLVMSSPASDTVWNMGQQVQIIWTAVGRVPTNLRLRLSVDGGQSYGDAFVENMFNTGYYVWAVPEVTTTDMARIKIEGINSGRIVAMGLSSVFSINGLVPEPAPVPELYSYDIHTATTTAATIGIDKTLSIVEHESGTVTCHPNSRIRTVSSSSVYYCGTDGKRYVFPNQKTHDTWYVDFAGIIEIEESEMALLPLGGNVTYRPGVRMVKIQTDPKVYAVDAGGTLRWVKTEAVAERLYGANWNQMIDDVPDAFFVNYTVGNPIE